MSTFITRLADGPAGGLRVAVKDCIDVAGAPTTAGSPVLAERAERGGPAAGDAGCLAGLRAARAQVVGKANLHELCYGRTGVNRWFGTPCNPIDPARIPGGSSSGSAVAVATGEADLAVGTDTVGSIRNPSACCGTVGLKTTFGRVPLDGVWPLAPSLDTVGPMAADVAGVAAGMALLDPAFEPAHGLDPESVRVGRYRLPADPVIDAAVDGALAVAGFRTVDVRLGGWEAATEAAVTLMIGEAYAVHRELYATHPDRIGDDLRSRFEQGRQMPAGAVADARGPARDRWQGELTGAFASFDLIALPALPFIPELITDAAAAPPNPAAPAVNLAGIPALALPVPVPGSPFPASLQLLGPHHSEALLLAVGAVVERANRR